ncbi:hypothetical protein [Microbacterium sp. NPDC056234]|uniref:hypothetical protein n=1 Tax=Microbacterium sp. NPDC056234 TaxID=3345757 RepID=UPI0035DB9DF7
MPPLLRTFGRILARHGVLLVTWYLAGEALHELLVQIAGFVGGHTTLGGLLLLPLAVAARLVSYVAMYLTVRPSLPHILTPQRQGPREFGAAILPAILPFFAFYAAWGMLTADQIEFFNIASVIALNDSGFDLTQMRDRGGLVSVGVLPVAVLVIALVARFVFSRFRESLPSWTLILAAYAEVLWTFMLFTLVGQWWAGVVDWTASRTGAQWLEGIGDWFAANLVLVAGVWEAGTWAFGILIAAVIVPAAWLLVAGVIYGTAFDGAVPRMLRTAADSRGTTAILARTLTRRFEDLWAGVAVVWRGGPVLFGAYALAYCLWALAERTGTRGLLQVIGGHESEFWKAFLPLILVAVAAVAEPLRVAIVATAYDSVIGRPEAGLESRAPGGHAVSRLHGEAEDGAILVGHVEPERTGRVVGDDEDREDVVRR